jgi:hypothetical protein
MNRPDPIEYAERLYDAICAANFSPISSLAFGNAVKDGVPLRNLPRIAAEPFMRIVGEMLELEEEAADGDSIFDAELVEPQLGPTSVTNGTSVSPEVTTGPQAGATAPPEGPVASARLTADKSALEPPPAGEGAPASNDSASAARDGADSATAGGEPRRNGKRA